jgi:hypothetical protein
VNKEGFNQLVSDYSRVDQKFQELEQLVHEYPYSQPVRMLNMKSSSKLSKLEFQKRLSLAAFYSTDRNVLRSLVEHGTVPSDSKSTAPKARQKPPASTTAKKKVAARVPIKKKADIEALRNEVLTNLETLQKTKAHFLELTESGEIDIAAPKTKSKPKAEQAKKTKATSPKSIRKSLKAKPKTSRSRTKKDDIIDKFIAEEPSITPNKKPQDNQSDLSKPSSVLKEDLVSENLAIIFAKQGKTAKAIEIYKKLIWKFPQKKASFAARIEELKQK